MASALVQELVGRAITAPPQVWAKLLLKRERAYGQAPRAVQESLLASALAHGAKLAAAAGRDRGLPQAGRDQGLPQAGCDRGLPLVDLAAACGAAVAWTEQDPMAGPVLFQAEYVPAGAKILLYRQSLTPLTELAVQVGLAPLLRGASAADIYLAHELYHHLAYQEKHPGWAVAQTWLRWFRRRLPVRGLSEVAAHAFVQHLLGITFPPVVLDCLSLMPFDESEALRCLQTLADVATQEV